MRTYPSNSPEAAARIVALAMLADGNVCHREMQALDALHGRQVQGKIALKIPGDLT